MKVERNGENFKVHPFPTSWDFWTGWADGTWEPESFEIIDDYLGDWSTFVDIGAWIGPLTIYAARRCARVVSLEPDPVARAVLRENVKRNRLENVEVLPYAVSNHTGQGMFGHRGHGGDPGEYGNSMSALGIGTDDRRVVETITPADLWDALKLENVGLVKIDIEGGEARLVNYADMLTRQPLLFAYHGPWMSPADRVLVSASFGVDANGFGTVLL